MRFAALVLAMLALAGCGDRRTFDERYDDTSKQLEDKARELDQNLSAPAPEPVNTQQKR